jgi:putative transposase
MMFPLVLDLANDKIPVAVTCRVLGFSKQAFYYWRASPVSQRDWDDAHLINAAIDIHHDDPEFGYRYIADEPRPGCDGQPQPGQQALLATSDLLGACEEAGRAPQTRAARSRRPGAPRVHRAGPEPAMADRHHRAPAEGKLYLCAVKDACSKRLVGYSIDERMTSQLAVNALRNAVALRGSAETIVHSDRGSQFRSHAYQRVLRNAGLHGSMGRVGICDNAAMESFFSLLQKNVLNRQRWTTRAELRLAIVVWIEKTYHRRRRQATLGRVPWSGVDPLAGGSAS